MRLLTKSDFDGMACAALLKGLGVIDGWKFVHPREIEDGMVEAGKDDILANIPYIQGCGMWFNNHSAEEEGIGADVKFEGEVRCADSTARVIYDFYNGKEKLPQFEQLVIASDKLNSAKFTRDEILSPSGWVLLGFILDPGTGLGSFKDFRINNYELIEVLINEYASKDIDEIMKIPDIEERALLYFEHDTLFKKMLVANTKTDANVIVTDLRDVETIYAGNKFLIYSLYPAQNISILALGSRNKRNCSIAAGHSALNRTCVTDIGALMQKYGGSGHVQIGTCRVSAADTDRVIGEMTAVMKEDFLSGS